MYTINGGGADKIVSEAEAFPAPHPKNTGFPFSPKLTKVFTSGTAGNAVPLAMGSRLRA